VRVSVDHVTKVFGDVGQGGSVVAVEDASFDVGRGEFVALVGPSGCGKSTLLNVIAGLIEPTEGRILIDSREESNRRQKFGYMFQRDLLLPWRTIRANVALGVEVLGVPKRKAREMAGDILDEFGLGAFADKFPVQLSGGMRQRAAFMRTLLCQREILLLDEPFGALDALTRSVMQEWLLKVWERDHRTIVFITHDIEEAVFLSDRILTMSARPGRIKSEFGVDLSRPRDHTILTTPEFTALKQRVLDDIHEESVRVAEAG
jgi:ABC-type nitrate/sulfonate/bicarbonate transport system ATPase subunit